MKAMVMVPVVIVVTETIITEDSPTAIHGPPSTTGVMSTLPCLASRHVPMRSKRMVTATPPAKGHRRKGRDLRYGTRCVGPQKGGVTSVSVVGAGLGLGEAVP